MSVCEEPSDGAWARVITLVESAVEEVYCRFDTLLGMQHVAADDFVCSSLESLRQPSVAADIRAVCEAGDWDLLEEVSLDLALDCLKGKVIPRFFCSIPGASENHPSESDEATHVIELLQNLDREAQAL